MTKKHHHPFHRRHHHHHQQSQLDHFNELLNNAKEMNTCDSECQYRKKSQELHKRLERSLEVKKELPGRIEDNEREFIVFTKGKQFYKNMVDKKIKKDIEEILRQFILDFNNDSKNMTRNIDTYDNLYVNYDNVKDLYKTYKKENMMLRKNIKIEGNDILTNERKTYYEEQGITTLLSYNYALSIIYAILLVLFIIFFFVYPTDMGLGGKAGVILGLVVLYFVLPYILGAIIATAYFIYGKLPKNVYATKTD